MSRPCTLGVGCQEWGVCYAAAHGDDSKCDARPDEPTDGTSVWYRGWEVGYDDMAARYVKDYWRAYKGGCDLDAPQASANTFDGVLDAIDDEEDDA